MRRAHLRSAAVLLALVLCTCTDGPTGLRQGQGRIAFEPTYSAEAHQIAQSLSAAGLAIDKVFIEVRGAAGDVRASQLIDFPADQSQTKITISVRLTAAREYLTATVQLRSGATPIFASATPITVWQSQTTVTQTSPLLYVGPGAGATLLKVQPPQATIAQTGSQQFAAAASAANQSPVADLPITGWTSSDPTIATVNAAGLVQALKSGTVTITARALNLLVATASLHIVGLPARVTVLGGAAQSATVATTLPQQFQVQVLSAAGEGVPGMTVNFQAITTGGSVGAATATTDVQGLASTTATLGTAAGAYEFRASLSGAGSGGPQPASITATAQAGGPASIMKVSGDAQSGTSGQAVTAPLVVRVSDTYGNPVSGVNVIFTRLIGTGAISASTVVTGGDGLASTGYTLGTTAGNESIRADVAGLAGAGATFSLTSNAGVPTAVVPVTREAQRITAGGSLAGPLVALVTDTHGNPVAAVNVAWRILSGSGSLSADHSSTNTAGEASINYTSDGHAGTTLITASIGGSSVQFTVVVDVGAPAQMSITGGTGQAGIVGTALKDELSVLVTDVHANPIPSVAVTFAAAANSGSVGSNASTLTVSTGANGIAHTSWHLGGAAGAQSVTASSSGLTTLSFTATALVGTASQIAVTAASNNQSAPSGTAVSVAPSVHVTDSFGNPVAGATVTFMPRDGSGSVSASSSTTDATGAASAGGWTLGASAGAQTLDVSVGTLTASVNAIALPTLTITASGRGSGTITSQPAGVSCALTSGAASGPCSFVPAFDAVVTLTAANAANSVFDGFSGVCAGKNPCSVTMRQSMAIGASFSRVQRTLTVAGGGSGSGVVTSTPAGITCGITGGAAASTGCTAQFEDGTTVTLNERPSAGFKLTSWGNGCPVAKSCVLTMTQDQPATAMFSLGSWTAMSLPSGTPLLHGIWGSSGKQVFAVGSGGTILGYDGSTWKSLTSDAVRGNLWDAWGSSSTDVHAASQMVDGQGQRVHYDGGSWGVASVPNGVSFYTVWGTSSSNIYFAGDYGNFLRFDGGTDWKQIETRTQSTLAAVWGSSANDVYIVGLNGTALHYDGQGVTPFRLPDLATEPFTESLGSVWGSSANDVWIGGGDSSGDLWHWDGASWTKQTLWAGTGGVGVNGIWGTSKSDVWAVGGNHAYHYDGTKWAPAELPLGASTTLIRVWGCGPLDVFATGVSNGAGVIYHYQ